MEANDCERCRNIPLPPLRWYSYRANEFHLQYRSALYIILQVLVNTSVRIMFFETTRRETAQRIDETLYATLFQTCSIFHYAATVARRLLLWVHVHVFLKTRLLLLTTMDES